ncbi:MAG: hypothetical protein AAGJ46_03385 [Planctomycetota bacterium]
MSRSRSAADRQDGPLLETWRQPKSSWALPAQRFVFTVLLLSLVGGLVYLIVPGIWGTHTYFFSMPARVGVSTLAPIGESVSLPPIAYVYEDFAEFVPLGPVLDPIEKAADSDKEPKRIVFSAFGDRSSVGRQFDYLEKADLSTSGALILAVTAHGLVTDQGPVLACSSYDPVARPDEVVPVRTVLERLAKAKCKTKLLLLDAGRAPSVARVGTVVDGFPDQLAKVVEEVGAPSVYVLTANSPGERSHVSPARKRSVFAAVTAAGLRGLADTATAFGNNDDRVDLAELAQFVRGNVAAWVAKTTNNRHEQTPQLLGKRAGDVKADRPHLIYCKKLTPPNTSPTAAPTPPERGFAVFALEYLSARASEFGINSVSSAVGVVNDAVLGGEDPPSAGDADEEEVEPSIDAGTGVAGQARDAYEEAWRLTEKLADSDQPPASYAPHLWRLHLDRLRWLGQLRESGDLAERTRTRIADRIGAIRRSLKKLDESAEPPDVPENAVDLVHAARPTLKLNPQRAPTLALLDRIADDNPDASFTEERQKFVDFFRGWSDPENLSEIEDLEKAAATWNPEAWNGRDWPQARAAFYEWSLLQDFDGAKPNLRLLKTALRSRWLAAEVTADPLWGQGWAAALVARADDQRLEAERLLRTRAASDWKERVNKNLITANEGYRAAQEGLELARNAEGLYHTTGVELRDFLRWTPFRNDPDAVGVRDLLTYWGEVGNRLAPGVERDLKALKLAVKKLADQRASLLAELRGQASVASDPATANLAEPGLLVGLVDSPLLGIDVRGALAERIAALDRLKLQGVQLGPQPEVQRRPVETTNRLSLERAVYDAAMPDSKLPDAAPTKDRAVLIQESLDHARRLGELPQAVSSSVVRAGDLQTPGNREKNLLQLERAARAMALVDAADSAAAATADNALVDAVAWLYDSRWYDLLEAHRRRLLRLRRDASEAESRRLAAAADTVLTLGVQLNKLKPNQPAPVSSARQAVEISVDQKTASVQQVKSATIQLKLKSRAEVESQVWLVAQHDETLVDVECALATIQRESVLSQELDAKGLDQYPYRPDLVSDSSFSLAPGAEKEFPVTILLKKRAGADTTVVLKAISNTGGYARAEVDVAMPGNRDIDLLVSDGRQSIVADGGQDFTLYPNRPRSFAFNVTNDGGVPKKVIARLYASGNETSGPVFQPGAVDGATAAARLGKLVGDEPYFAQSEAMTVSPGSEEQLVLGVENWRPPPQPGAKQPPSEEIGKGGLVIAIAEFDAERTEGLSFWQADGYRLRGINFRVREPQDYVEAFATYDRGAQQLSVLVRHDDSRRTPLPGEVKVQLSVPREYTVSGSKLDGVISPASPACTVKARLRDPERWPTDPLWATVRVDDYPRAFMVPLTRRQASFDRRRLTDDATRVEILSVDGKPAPADRLLEIKAFEKDTIDVQLAVDTSQAFFQSPGARVRVGIDAGGLQTFDGDDPEDFEYDRSISISAMPPRQGGGTLLIGAAVSDVTVPVSIAGLSGVGFELLALVEAARGLGASDSFELVIDGEDPEFGSPEYIVPRPAGEFPARIKVTDASTDVKRVQARIVTDLDPVTKWADASRDGTAWKVVLKTDALDGGEYFLEWQAEDTVGNVATKRDRDPMPLAPTAGPTPQSTATTETIKKPPPPPRKAKSNRVYGRLKGRASSFVSPSVKLVGDKTIVGHVDASLTFRFPAVPPGTYELVAEATVSNKPRRATQPVEVSDKPGDSKDLGLVELKKL